MQRDTFFDDMQSMSFEELKQKYAAPIKVSLVTRAKRKTKKTIKSLLRVIGGGPVSYTHLWSGRKKECHRRISYNQ